MTTPSPGATPPASLITPETRVTWICSYPKSGNTWVRFLLYHYFHAPAKSSEEISRFVPDIHVKGDVQAGRPMNNRLLVKTHFPLGPRMPLLPVTTAYIYVIRNPRDTILSCLNYIRLTRTETPGTPPFNDEKYIRAFITLGGAPEYVNMNFGTWENHYRAWLDQTRIPGMLVRYEDLKSQPAAELGRIVEFLGLTPDPEKIATAVKHSSFDQMRALEVKEKSAGKTGAVFAGGAEKVKKGVFFMNKGQSGRSLEPIVKGLDKAVDDRFAEAIKRFGY